MSPRVTVIIPTYNRSNLIGYAIQSVLWQTLADFELLVVGDGCTDNTAEVVASFNDARIHWHNLPENSGNQAAANNYGIEQAQGRYIAYLGHDDLWYFNHLEALVGVIEAQQAALVHSLCAQIGWNGIRALAGVPTDAYLQPSQPFVPPGSVLHTRAMVDHIGFWRDHRTIDVPPDRDFFGRVRATGQKIVAVPELTFFKFPAVWRPESYRRDFSAEQAEYARRMREEDNFIERELIDISKAYVLGQTTPAPSQDAYNPRIKHYGWRIERNRRIRGLAPRATPMPTPRHLLDYVANIFRRLVRRAKRHLSAAG